MSDEEKCNHCKSTDIDIVVERFGITAHRCKDHSEGLRRIAYANEDGTFTVVRDGQWVQP